MQDSNSVQARFQAALEALIEKVRCDPTILAAVLMGSLAHDRVWEKSDIDLLLVTQEGKLRQRSFSLVENGVTIHAYLETRSEFRKTMEGSRQGSEVLHYRSRLLFSRDESLQELFENRNRVGTRDQSAGILSTAQWLMATLTKTEKWLFARGDLDYCLYWILRCVDLLATIVVLRHGETPGRKALHQARRYEPELVEYLFHGVIHGDRDAPSLEAALTRIRAYLLEGADELFAPLFEYLAATPGIRSTTELNHYFSKQYGVQGLDILYEWLAEEGRIGSTGTAVRLTDRSRVDVEEAAYYFDAPEPE